MENPSTFASVRPSLVAGGSATCERLVDTFLTSIRRQRHLNAFLSVFDEQARTRAREIDSKITAGRAGTLAGMVIAVKDAIAIRGEKLTCASKQLEQFVAPYDATVIQRLQDEDAIIIGKTNMDEFAMGSSTETSAFGPVLNPVNELCVPGGSSGGSAVAVACQMAHTALGSDTGGSIRQPASFCGIVGLKPTYGRVSRYGLVALSSSFDQIGPFAHSVEDAASVLQVIAGSDAMDSTSANVPVPEYRSFLTGDVRGVVIGVPFEILGEGLDPEVREAMERCVEILKEHGATIRSISLPHSKYNISTYYVLMTAEASSNLARYDGARYGYRSDKGVDLSTMYTTSRSEGFGAGAKRRIMLGTYVLSAGYYDAYYRKAQKVRRLIQNDFLDAFKHVDCVLLPTSPTTAFEAGTKIHDPLQMYLSDVFTVSANLAGLPAISVPFGRDTKGLPIGIQCLGKHFDEGMILRVGEVITRMQ